MTKKKKILDGTFKLINSDPPININLIVIESSKFYFHGDLIFEGVISQTAKHLN